ncbi:MAG: prepilin-type N-terminal cleavage/methylation domain-containing protein [Planctomycetota bacterium]
MSSHQAPVSRRTGAFTLVEVIVVIAAVALLSAIITPMIVKQINDSKIARARNECQVIASALGDFFKDVGVFPTMDGNGSLGKVQILVSGDSVPARNPFIKNTAWFNKSKSDTLSNHLTRNAPDGSQGGYPTTGQENHWNGPYADDLGADPWGRPYLCNVLSSYSTDPTKYRKLLVLSAGPNGVVETNFQTRDQDEITGDDIGIVIHRR